MFSKSISSWSYKAHIYSLHFEQRDGKTIHLAVNDGVRKMEENCDAGDIDFCAVTF